LPPTAIFAPVFSTDRGGWGRLAARIGQDPLAPRSGENGILADVGSGEAISLGS
jgi:hypothetical protein